MLHASVIVCTYNRATLLPRTLRSLQAQALRPGIEWEVLVVDNNSSDDTRAVVEAFSRTFPNLRYSHEPQQGLAFARNHGIHAARGRVLLFTDDDVAPEADWMQRILDGMEVHACDACGGFIAPEWESPPPAWLTERFHGILAIKAERTDTYEIKGGEPVPYGANMAFRREVFDHFGLFDVTRGRRGKILASGEDGELFGRMLAKGIFDEKKKRIEVIKASKIHKWQDEHPDWHSIASEAEIGKRLKADYVVYLELGHMRFWEEGSNKTLFQGKAEMTVTVIKVDEDEGEVVFPREYVTVEFPKGRPIPAGNDMSMPQFRRMFITRIAQRVCWIFLPHERSDEFEGKDPF